MSGRCTACNNIMNPQEMTRRNRTTNEFVDLCSSCLRDTGIVYYDNPANKGDIIVEEEADYSSEESHHDYL